MFMEISEKKSTASKTITTSTENAVRDNNQVSNEGLVLRHHVWAGQTGGRTDRHKVK